MLALIIKDLKFTRTRTLTAIGIVLVGGILLVWLHEEGAMMALLMSPALLFGQSVGHGCYMDDKDGGFAMLRALPLRARDIVWSRYLEALVALLVALALTWTATWLGGALRESTIVWDANLATYVASTMLFYFSLYLAAFFYFDYSVAQQTSLLAVVMLLGLTQAGELLNLLPTGVQSTLEGMPAGDIALAAAVVMFLATAIASAKGFESRN